MQTSQLTRTPNQIELDLKNAIRDNLTTVFENEAVYWHAKDKLLEKILVTLQLSTVFTVEALSEFLRFICHTCIGGPIRTTWLSCFISCRILDALGNSLDRETVRSITNKILVLLDSSVLEERQILRDLLYSLYKNNVSFRGELRQLFGFAVTRQFRGLPFHEGTDMILEVLFVIIQGFLLPVKQEHIMFCRKNVFPLVRSEMLEKFHGSLFQCISYLVVVQPSLSCEIASLCLEQLDEARPAVIPVLFNFALDLIAKISSKEFISVSSLLFERTSKYLKDAQFAGMALRVFEDTAVFAHLSNHSVLAKEYLLPALHRASLTQLDSNISTRCAAAACVLATCDVFL